MVCEVSTEEMDSAELVKKIPVFFFNVTLLFSVITDPEDAVTLMNRCLEKNRYIYDMGNSFLGGSLINAGGMQISYQPKTSAAGHRAPRSTKEPILRRPYPTRFSDLDVVVAPSCWRSTGRLIGMLWIIISDCYSYISKNELFLVLYILYAGNISPTNIIKVKVYLVGRLLPFHPKTTEFISM